MIEMAIVRELNNSDNIHTYLATVALFCGISCSILMLKFRGFKASLNLSSGKRSGGTRYELAPQVSVDGAYRCSRDEFIENNNNYLDSRKQITPSMVQLPANMHIAESMKPAQSTGDLLQSNNASVELRKSTPNITALCVPKTTPRSAKETKNQLKEQKKLEKKRIAEEKQREKLAAQEREKQEKLIKDRERQAAQQQAKLAKERDKQRKRKPIAPHAQQNTTSPQRIAKPPQQSVTSVKQSRAPPPPPFKTMGQPSQGHQNPGQYSTNTLESSISRSSGPPPYADITEFESNKSDRAGNTSFGKPVETPSSWDMITQHRQQISRTPGATVNKTPQKPLDLQYNVGNISKRDKDNSELSIIIT